MPSVHSPTHLDSPSCRNPPCPSPHRTPIQQGPGFPTAAPSTAQAHSARPSSAPAGHCASVLHPPSSRATGGNQLCYRGGCTPRDSSERGSPTRTFSPGRTQKSSSPGAWLGRRLLGGRWCQSALRVQSHCARSPWASGGGFWSVLGSFAPNPLGNHPDGHPRGWELRSRGDTQILGALQLEFFVYRRSLVLHSSFLQVGFAAAARWRIIRCKLFFLRLGRKGRR